MAATTATALMISAMRTSLGETVAGVAGVAVFCAVRFAASAMGAASGREMPSDGNASKALGLAAFASPVFCGAELPPNRRTNTGVPPLFGDWSRVVQLGRFLAFNPWFAAHEEMTA